MTALRRQAELDELTGVYNKRTFYKKTRAMLAAHPDVKFTMMRWDLQNFKVVNDLHGVLEGDRLLAYIGSCLRAKLADFSRRSGLKQELSTYGYMGADSFIFCLPTKFIDPEEIVRSVAADLAAYDLRMELVPYFGLYDIDDPALDVEIMCDRTLLAIRSIKGSYTTRYAYYTSEMRDALLAEQKISNEMESALASGQFRIFVQPQYDYVTGAISGAEALVRWLHPQAGFIPPSVFVPIFEKNGFITKMDEFVWDLTCKLIRELTDDPSVGAVPPISVNISRRDIYNEDLCGKLTSLVKKYGLPISALNLEITESAYAKDPQQLIETVQRLRSSGFVVEMDDFGSGYSSLNSLKDVPVDILKLDLSFLRNSGDSKRGGNILSSIIRMARWLEIPVIAEGVETSMQASFLNSVGCGHMQGYLFAKPLPVEEFKALLAGGRVSVMRSVMDDRKRYLDVNELWDPDSQMSEFFNNYMPGAAIFEYRNGELEALRCNDAYFRELGSSREEYHNVWRSVIDRLLPEDRPAYVRTLERAAASGRPESCETRSLPLRRGGEQLWIRTIMKLIVRSEDKAMFCITIENITERKKAEALEREAQAHAEEQDRLLRGLFSSSCEICIVDYAHETARLLYSKDNPESSGGEIPLAQLTNGILERVHPKYRPQLQEFFGEEFQRASQTVFDQSASVEYPIMLEVEEVRWHAARMTRTGDSRYLLTIMDITYQRKARPSFEKNIIFSELRREQKRLNAIIDNMPVGIGIYRLEEGRLQVLYMNDMNRKILGCVGEDFRDAGLTDKSSLTFDEPARIVEQIAAVEIGRPVEKILRARGSDDSVVWLRAICSAVMDEHDGVVYYTAVLDATAAVETEKKLAWQAERYRLLSENQGSVTFDYDTERDVMTYSVCTADKGREERVVENCLETLKNSKIVSDDTKEVYGRALTAASNVPTEGCVEYRADYYGSGEYRWCRANYVSVADKENNVYRVVGRVDDVQEAKQREHELTLRAEQDAVTGLLNRATMEEFVNAALDEESRAESVLIVLDIDNFKAVNDNYGHPVGDRILRFVGDTARAFCRPDDIIGRLGGDEFVIFMRGVRSAVAITGRISAFLAKINRESIKHGVDEEISISAGIASVLDSDETFDDVFARADKALYDAKALGKNRCAVYQPKSK
jgi:diguanylate cyclase (GGDEF)-like protein/PAS domain S-box-containing protein